MGAAENFPHPQVGQNQSCFLFAFYRYLSLNLVKNPNLSLSISPSLSIFVYLFLSLSLFLPISLCMFFCVVLFVPLFDSFLSIYMYVCVYIYICIWIYIYVFLGSFAAPLFGFYELIRSPRRVNLQPPPFWKHCFCSAKWGGCISRNIDYCQQRVESFFS